MNNSSNCASSKGKQLLTGCLAPLPIAAFAWTTIFLPDELATFFNLDMSSTDSCLYYIRRDIMAGIGALLGFLLLAPYAVYAWCRSNINNFELFGFAICFAICTYKILIAAAAIIQTQAVFSATPVIPWATAGEYITSKTPLAFTMPIIALTIYLVFLYIRACKRNKHKANG